MRKYPICLEVADHPEGRDYLQAYLNYATKISAGKLDDARAAAERLTPHQHPHQRRSMQEDGFASSVGAFMREIGYEPIPSNEGDAFGLDFAIRNPQTGLFGIGIECDAPRHELLRHARAREIRRPAVLSRAIPFVHRVASHAWYHRPSEERTRLRAAIRKCPFARNNMERTEGRSNRNARRDRGDLPARVQPV